VRRIEDRETGWDRGCERAGAALAEGLTNGRHHELVLRVGLAVDRGSSQLNTSLEREVIVDTLDGNCPPALVALRDALTKAGQHQSFPGA
jgi:hypothetical protein